MDSESPHCYKAWQNDRELQHAEWFVWYAGQYMKNLLRKRCST